MLRSRTTTVALTAGALVLPLGAAGPAAAAPGDANTPPAQSTAPLCAAVPDAFDPFTDIAGNTHQAAIQCAAYAEIAEGGPGSLPGNRYGPGLDVRRDQMASFVARMLDTAEQLDSGDAIQALPEFDGEIRFTDVSPSNPHAQAIERLAQAGIVSGGPGARPGSEYGPALPTDRAQMASFINRAIAFATGSQFQTQDDYFVDDEGSVHEQDINGVASAGIAVGTAEDLYTPIRSVPRDQMASFLMRPLAVLHEDGLIADVGAAPTGQMFIVGPQQPREVPAGEPAEFSVVGRYDAQEFTGPVTLALLPCEGADVVGGSPVTFPDADGDGLADGIASTDAGQAYISQVEGSPTGGPNRLVADQGPGQDGVLQFQTVSPRQDCAVVVAFDDQNGDRELAVDAQGRPTEPFGVGKVTWNGGSPSIAGVDADGRVVVLDGRTGEVQRVLLDGVDVSDPADNAIAVTPDRSTVFVVRPGAAGAQDSEIVRISAGGGAPETVAQGNAPAISPDGSTLAYVRFVDSGGPTPAPTIRIRDLATTEERELSGGQQEFYGIWELAWLDDGRIAFTAGEIGTSVYVIERGAASLDEAQRLGPENSDASWSDLAGVSDNRLAVVERCCQQPDPDPTQWHVIAVDATTGAVQGEVLPGRVEATLVDDRDDGQGLLVVQRGGPGGGALMTWDGSGELRQVADGIVVAAW